MTSADPSIAPLVRHGYLADADARRLRDGIALALELLGERADGRLDRDWILRNLMTADHSCGTCRMGPDGDERAVVDAACRVRGIDALRVVDLSVVPRSVRAGPYATVVMLSERAADLIAKPDARVSASTIRAS